MMPPGGAAARADMAATLERVLHARQTAPELDRLLDELEPWAAGRTPTPTTSGSSGGRGATTRRRARAERARGGDEPRARDRACRRGRRRWPPTTSPASATRSSARSSCASATSPASRAPQHPYDVLLDDFEPGLTTAELRPLFAELRDGAGAAGGRHRRRRAAAQRRRVRGTYPVDRAARRRCSTCSTRSAATRTTGGSTRRAPVRPGAWRRPTSASPPSTTSSDFGVALYSVLHEFGHGLYEAAADPRARAHDAGRAGLARRARVAEPDVGEHRRPLAPVLRLAAPAPARASRRLRAASTPAALYRAVNTRPAVADPHRGRRDDVQPPHHPALRARAGADGGHARGRRPARAPGTRAIAAAARARRSRATPRASCRTPTGAPG